VGVVADLVSQNRGRSEVVWQGTSAVSAMEALGANCHVAGETVRATLQDAQLQEALAVLRTRQLRLISVNPVGGSLEQYFLEKLGTKAEVHQ
jgi:hypothetical protein